MKKLLFLISAMVFFVACATEGIDPGQISPEPVAETDPLTVPLDEALDEMYSLMDDIYGPSTRAASRTVGEITTFKTPGTLTRAGEEPTLSAYVVNFAEGGFAVLGAHAAVPSVLCVTDAGEFTAEEVEQISRKLASPVVATRAGGNPDWMSYIEEGMDNENVVLQGGHYKNDMKVIKYSK